MFYDPLEKKVIDYVKGQEDLRKKIIRTIGDPTERFGEDYLRMLRAVRFSTQLKFRIEPETFSAVCENAVKITKISGERIAMELEAILVSPNRSSGILLLMESGLAEALFPGFTGESTKFAVKVLTALPNRIDLPVALAALFSGCSLEFALEKCRLLKLSRNQTRHIKFLLTNRGKLLDDKMTLAQLKMFLAEPYFEDLYQLQKAIQKAQNKGISSLIKLRRRISALGDIDIKPKPLLNGHDLINLGAVPGPGLGQLAREMYIAQLDGTLQTSEQSRQWVRKWLQKHMIK
jgi:tRNA nucleotidyltransferase/poly(A) polymerase